MGSTWGHQQVTMSASNVPATAEAPAAAAFRYSAPYAAGPAYGYGGPQYGGAQYGGAMVAAAPGYGYGAPAPLAPVHAPMAAAGPAPVSYGGPGHHVYHSGRVAEDLRAEETYLESRRKLTEAHEQSRRAATAEAIAARATEELRLREAEARAANAAAAEAKALCERAAEADRRATEARNNEVQAANTKAQAARESESVLAKSVADNEAAAAQLANCEGAAANTPLPGSYCSGPYQRQYAYGGPGAAPAAQYGYRGYGY